MEEVSQIVIKSESAKMKKMYDKDFTIEMLSGGKRHWCPAFEYSAIDDTMPEFDKCKCDLGINFN